MENPFSILEGKIQKLENMIQLLLNQQQAACPAPEDKIGGIELAIQITGLKKATIYSHVHKGNIPHFKRGGKLYFSKTALQKWITQETRGDPVRSVPALPPLLFPYKSKSITIKNKI